MASIEACAAEIRRWLNANKLKLSDAKTEVLFITRKSMHTTPITNSVAIDECNVKPVKHTRNLGVVFDGSMTME